MDKNPFTPAFGGKPQHFFGRAVELALIEDALENELSPHRALFVTGNRGCGKTSLLEQASGMAQRHGWVAVDVHAEDSVMSVVKKLAGGTGKTTTKVLQPQVMGVSAGSVSSETSVGYSGIDLADVIREKLEAVKAPQGVFISVDEVQKIDERNAEGLCIGVQMTMRKGLPVMLVLAGLPGSKERIAAFEGCTFMQRALDVKLSSLLVEETYDAFDGLLGLLPHVGVGETVRDGLARFSLGYPYLIQLIGFHALRIAQENRPVGVLDILPEDVAAAEGIAYEAYRDNVLKPAVAPLRNGTLDYLRAMARCIDGSGRAQTPDVAAALGKETPECSTARQRLIDRRLIVPDGRGFVRFNMPYLGRYLLEEEAEDAFATVTPGSWLF
ncbi:MAG: ATP-binding protein [Eggerthellaceae bacterium]|nr:ATP-binding protein [Eggerthellaceae bacterium]